MSWSSGHLGPSGNLRDIQGSSVTSGMTLWHAGTLLACWHSRQTHGIQTNDEHTASQSGRLQTPGSCGRFTVSGFMMSSVDLRQSSETAPTQ